MTLDSQLRFANFAPYFVRVPGQINSSILKPGSSQTNHRFIAIGLYGNAFEAEAPIIPSRFGSHQQHFRIIFPFNFLPRPFFPFHLSSLGLPVLVGRPSRLGQSVLISVLLPIPLLRPSDRRSLSLSLKYVSRRLYPIKIWTKAGIKSGKVWLKELSS